MKNLLRVTQIILLLVIAVIFIDIARIAIENKRTDKKNIGAGIEIDTGEIATPDYASPTDGKFEEKTTLEEATPTEATPTEAVPEEVVEEDSLPDKALIEMEIVYQHPELPTGCESVALTMLLKYYGFELDKTTIASDYLVYSGSNFAEGYVGNPFSYGGAGIYSPGLTRTANNYLHEQETTLNAKNITGSSPETLYKYIANDTPVVVWNTIHMAGNVPGYTVEHNGVEYHWDDCEHCVVLTGYDLERNVVVVNDPVDGIVERDAEMFWERYRNLGSMAIMIR